MSKSAIQTFVQKPFAKDVPTWERLQVFFENAELPNDENHLENEEQVYLFPGQDKAVSSQEVSNIYNLIKRSKAQNLAAWPQQEASTASVGGSLLHLGLSLALGNPEQEVIPELRGQYSDSVNPLQLCLLNVLLKSLNSKYTFGDAAASEKSVLSAVPYIFGPNMMTQFKCVDDSLTFRSGKPYQYGTQNTMGRWMGYKRKNFKPLMAKFASNFCRIGPPNIDVQPGTDD